MPEVVEFHHYIRCKYFTQHALQRSESMSQADKQAVLFEE